MVLTLNEMRNRSDKFIEQYKDVSDEKSYAQMFWRDFFNIFGVNWKDVAVFEQAVKKFSGSQGFIDCFWKGKLIIEHKSRGKSLTSAFNQAIGYLDTLSSEEKPRYVIVSDFDRIRLVDLFTNKKNEIHLTDLTENIQLFRFIYEDDVKHHEVQAELNIEAAELMGNLYDTLKEDGYVGHDLELFLIRLLFCVYAEDTGIFKPYQFYDYIGKEEDPLTVGMKIQMLFRILNQTGDERQNNLPEEVSNFPYVNGKLFEVPIVPPNFDYGMYRKLKDICKFDWSTISPAIFGSLFQSIMDTTQRRQLGAHYTSEANILKVINSLFMNDLWEEFYQAKGVTWKLESLWNKMANLEFFDPACGCGNFLIVAYRELRLLEYEILSILLEGDKKQVRFDTKSLSKIKLNNFHGIEIEEFPSLIAKVSMWLIQHQMDLKYETLDIHENNLPLKSSADIHNTNALRIDWRTIVTPTDNLFILGNPPFAGKSTQNKSQKEDMAFVFKDYPKYKSLDYVTAWYKKALEYIQNTKINVGYVSTNSICQGEQVPILWTYLNEKFDFHINFAHQSFKWSNEAKNNAGVYVIIIGFSLIEKNKKMIFTYEKPTSSPIHKKVEKINSYLIEGEEITIKKRSKPISPTIPMIYGSEPREGGNLILSASEKEQLITEFPETEKYIHDFIGANEFLNNKKRYCLWLVNSNPSDLINIKPITERINNVKTFRINSSRKKTQEKAEYPTEFEEIRQPKSDYVLIPCVSSENREYIPIGYVSSEKIVNNSVFTLDSDDKYLFGILTSKMHMVWTKYICGRLKGDFRYSNTLVYNNLPFPKNVNEDKKNEIIYNVQDILNIRNDFPNESLAKLYNPLVMPPKLKKAHFKLDGSVDKCYRSKKFKDDIDRMSFLFNLYQEYTQ